MDLGRPDRADWPAALYAVALLVPPGLFALGWAQGYCGITRCHESRPVLVTLAGLVAVAVPSLIALALHRRRPLAGRVGARLPSGDRGRRLAAASLLLVPPTGVAVLVVLGSDLSEPTTLPALPFLLPLVAANALLRDAVPGPLSTGLGFAAIGLAGVWVVALAALADAGWRRLVGTVGDRHAVVAAIAVLVVTVGAAGAMHVDVPYGRHVTWAEPAEPPDPPATLTEDGARDAAARHAAVATRNRLLERYGAGDGRRVGSVAVECPTTRVLARDPDAVYVETYCFPSATVVSTPWGTERYSGPLWSLSATYAVRRDGVARVDAPVVAGHVLAPGRGLAGVDLADADLGQADLHGATLDGADLSDASLSATNLSAATLGGADLRNASFAPRLDATTRLVEADLRGASVSGHPSLAGIDARGARFDDAALGSGIAGAAADLTGADLANASFAGAQMRQVTLDGAELRDADLAGAMLYRASLREADLHRANLSGADLGLADLTGADLTGADLRDARLWEADLREADLRGAALNGSRWREARLDGARLPENVSR